MLLDKNPEQIIDDNLTSIQNELEQNNLNIILCTEPFHKTEFLHRLIDSVSIPVIFVDLDLLYTGYIESGMIQRKKDMMMFNPNKIDWKEKLVKIISKISQEKFLVIIDSFNGVYTLFDDLESARFINASMMLISSLGKQSRSSIVVTAMARRKDDSEWVISPGGKHIIKSEKTRIYFVKKSVDDLVIGILDKTGINSKTFKIGKKII